MKQIKILLSSVLTLLLITGNNTYAAYELKNVQFQGKNPNMNVFKGQVRKGNMFKRNMLPYTKTMDQRKIGTFIGIPPEPEYKDDFFKRKAGFIDNLLPAVQVNGYNCKDISGNCLDKSSPKFGGQEAKAVGDKTWNELQPRALGPDVVTTLEHGPGLHDSYDTGTVIDALQQPKGVPLQFIDGEWVESQSLKPYAWP